MPYGAMTDTSDLASRNLVVGRLQLLQAHDIRLCLVDPSKQHLEATIDPIDIIGGELQGRQRLWSPLSP